VNQAHSETGLGTHLQLVMGSRSVISGQAPGPARPFSRLKTSCTFNDPIQLLKGVVTRANRQCQEKWMAARHSNFGFLLSAAG